jgi:hypothetical protein
MIALAIGLFFSASQITIDPAGKEIRFPFTFVEPVQAVEVFGCSPGGPTHETIVVFEPTGSEIAEALGKIGLRNEKFWQISDAADFSLNQGDRVLVTLRWESHGTERVVFAEDLLWRTGEDLPELLYGFSYAGRTVPAPDGSAEKVPDLVEITVGGTGRQSAIASILIHPSAFDFLAPYVSALAPNPRYAREIADLAAEKRGGIMSFRWVTETELLQARLALPPPALGLADVLHEQEPLAREIDALKTELVSVRQEIGTLLDARDTGARDRVQAKLLQAQLLSWRINKAYLAMDELIWKFQREILESRLASFTASWEKGYEFLLEYTAERVKLAELRALAVSEKAPADLAPRIRRGETRLKELQVRRMIPHCREEIEFLTKRLAEARAEGSPYLEAMFSNDLEKWRVKGRTAELEAELHALAIREIDRALAGSEVDRAKIEARRLAIQAELACLALEGQIADIDEQIRWQKEEVESEDAERRARGQEKLAELVTQRTALADQLAKQGCAKKSAAEPAPAKMK